MIEGALPDLMHLRSKPATLASYGLPDISYPIRSDIIEQVMNQDEIAPAAMLDGLQQKSAKEDADWRGLESAMARLASLIAPEDEREVVTAAGEEWWLEIGPIDLETAIVTIQRGRELVAAMSPRPDGRLRAAAFRPLDGKSARMLISLALRPHPEHGVCMRENNWEYALDCSAGIGQWYAAERGEAHMSYWSDGIGKVQDGSVDEHWRAMRSLQPCSAANVAVELGIAYAFSEG